MQKSSVYLLGIVFGVGIASNDIYLSALPHLSVLHNISPRMMNCTLIGYFIATALACACYASLLAYMSRKQLLNICILMFVGASILITFADNAPQIILGRLLQGMAFGIIQPALIAMVKEQFQTATAQAMAAMSFASEAFCAVIPTIGALSFTYISWNSPFLIIGGVACVLFIKTQPIWAHPSLKPTQQKTKIHWSGIKRVAYTQNFLRFSGIGCLMNGLCWGTTTVSAYLFDQPLTHGLFYSCYGVFYALGCLICERQWMGMQRILQVFPYAIAGVGMLLGYGFFSASITSVTSGILLFGLLAGLIYGPVVAQALSKINQSDIDLASTLVIFTRLTGSSCFIAIASLLYFESAAYYAFFIVSICCLIAFLLKSQQSVATQLTSLASK